MSRTTDRFIEQAYPGPDPEREEQEYHYLRELREADHTAHLETCRRLGYAQGLLQSAIYALRSPYPDGDLAQRIEDYLHET